MSRDEILEKLKEFSRMANNRMKNITPKKTKPQNIVEDKK